MFIGGEISNEDRNWFLNKGYGLETHGNILYITGYLQETIAQQVPDLKSRVDNPMSVYRVLERWFGLGWYGTFPAERFALVEEEPLSFDPHWDAFIAGYTEWLCKTCGLTPPDWVYNDNRYLNHFWSPETYSDLTMDRDLLDGAAPWFLERGVLTSNLALLDSKYFIHKDYESLGYGNRVEPEHMPPDSQHMDWSVEWWEKLLTELAVRLEWRRTHVWVHLPSDVNSDLNQLSVIAEDGDRIDYQHVFQDLETEMSQEYGLEEGWVNQAAHILHADTSCASYGSRGHVIWYKPGLAVGCIPVDRLLAIKTMGAWEGDEIAIENLLNWVGIFTERELNGILVRWLPYLAEHDIMQPTRMLDMDAQNVITEALYRVQKKLSRQYK